VLVFFDISAQHRLARELRENQRLSRMLVEAAPEVIFSLRMEDGTLQSLNPAFESLTGWTMEEFLGRPFATLVHPRDMPKAHREVRRLLRGLRTRPLELRLRTRSRRLVAAEVVCTPLTEGGRVRGILGVARDITARKHAEREMRAAKEDAEAANRAKTDFLANISHELRTPLNAIIGMTGLLLETSMDEEQQDFVETVRSSGDTLLTLVNEILDFSKIESGHLEMEEQPFILATCIQSAMDLTAAPGGTEGVQRRVEVADDVPEVLVGDATRVQQVLVNLLSNATKFTDQGEIWVRAASRPVEDGTPDAVEIEIAVGDTGVGIAKEALETIFESFRQGDASTSRRHGGTGLGLAISQRLVQLMGGKIRVRSAVGEGSTFTFNFRARRPEADAVPATEEETGARSGFDTELARRLPLRILVAEDNVVNQKVTLLMLEKMGYRADLVANGLEAIEALERQRYDVVLMDVQMPELDGVDTTRRICRRWPAQERPWIVAMTASALEEDRRRCVEAGMQDFVSKPVYAAALQGALERVAKGGGGETPKAASPDTSLALDTLQTLYTMQPAKVAALIESFLEHSEEALEVILEAEAEADWDGLALAAHSLRGSAGTLGAHRVAQLCQRVEGDCLDGRGITRQELQRLQSAVEGATQLLRETLALWQEGAAGG
jgi:PAS domain S-box-containing protein